MRKIAEFVFIFGICFLIVCTVIWLNDWRQRRAADPPAPAPAAVAKLERIIEVRADWNTALYLDTKTGREIWCRIASGGGVSCLVLPDAGQ